MHTKSTMGQRLRYAFDSTLARGPVALIGWLALTTVIMIFVAVAIVLVTGGVSEQAGLGPRQVFWNIVFQALVPNPPGNFDSPLPFLLVMLGVTLASLMLVSILIGLLSAAIQNRIETLRRGRSQIIESNHTILLGWSEQVFAIMAELVIANQNQRRSTIAILGNKDQVEMEDEIRHRLTGTGHTRIVCRRGNATDPIDIDLVSPQTSKSIVILPPDDDAQPDAATIKTILALTKAPNRRSDPYRIVAVIRETKNMDVARLVGQNEVELVPSGEVIARIMAQTCRQGGLSVVYAELMDFAGDEIYFQEEPALVGKTFAEAMFAYENSAVIGVFTHDQQIRLSPPLDTVIMAGDQVIAISEDDDTVRLSVLFGQTKVPIEFDAISTREASQAAPERTLILGWNWRASTLIQQLDSYVMPGSMITVVAQHDQAVSEIAHLSNVLRHHNIQYEAADISSRSVLDGLQIYNYDHVILLCYSDTLDNRRADAITLLTLLHVRDIGDAHGHTFSLVSEMMDIHDRNLAESARADDFIVSDRLISMLMTQVSENRHLNRVFSELLDPSGAELFLKPAIDFILPDTPVTFYTVIEAARRRGEVAIGYRKLALGADRNQAYGVVINPDKSDKVSFGPQDQVIVLANL